jgi:hypothetical protein
VTVPETRDYAGLMTASIGALCVRTAEVTRARVEGTNDLLCQSRRRDGAVGSTLSQSRGNTATFCCRRSRWSVGHQVVVCGVRLSGIGRWGRVVTYRAMSRVAVTMVYFLPPATQHVIRYSTRTHIFLA